MKENQITYTQINGINYPNLTVPEQTDYPLANTVKCGLTFYRNTAEELTHPFW